MNRTVLVSGASIAGLSAANWLHRAGWSVTVIERAPQFRDGGQNIDIRGEAREVVQRMGIAQAIEDATTTEEGTVFVDEHGCDVARFPMRPDGEGLTAGLEILRGDLARILLDALPDEVVVRFGETIEAVTDSDAAAEVAFESGERAAYDLVVIAEGVRSTTRDLVFGTKVERRELGLTMVYGTIPRRESDDRWWHWYAATDARQITMRPDGHGTRRATMSYRPDGDGGLAGVPQEEMVARLRTRFAGAGWETERVLDGFADSDDVYADDLMQIRMPSWHRGRVCVVGDAAWCVTPLGGGGCSLALLGGYVLGAALSRHPTADVTDEHALETALAEFETWMRPDVDEVQSLPPGVVVASHPRSRAGVLLQRTALRVGALPPVRRLTQRFGGDTPRPLPDAAFVR